METWIPPYTIFTALEPFIYRALRVRVRVRGRFLEPSRYRRRPSADDAFKRSVLEAWVQAVPAQAAVRVRATDRVIFQLGSGLHWVSVL